VLDQASRVGRNSFARIYGATEGYRRSLAVFVVHPFLIGLATYLAISLRFDGDIPPHVLANYWRILPWTVVIRGLVFAPFGLYQGLWRYTSIFDLWRLSLAVFASSIVVFGLVYQPLGPDGLPRSIVIIESILLIAFVGGVRLLPRLIQIEPSSTQARRVLVLGAGDAGEMILREMKRGTAYHPVGFIDDDPTKIGRTIHGVTVLGTRQDLPRVIAAARPQEVLVAIPSLDSAVMRSVVEMLETCKLPITTLPGLKELRNGSVGVKQIRPLAIEDLLPRSPISLNIDEVRRLVEGKRVLVTGAGGSIGSELCRQMAALSPASLVCYERYENGLYAVANELVDRNQGVPIHSVVGDVTDTKRVESIFAAFRPELIFHAAAHKHLPLMETNPCEAVKNNVAGTQTVAEAARRHGVERFVLISTDKAVNPSSVMGATKRVAELIVQAVSVGSDTRFVTVRFGNVMGSNGSVVPRMADQIRAGGPVTITHPEIRRYFMLIPEAVELVLQAAVLAGNRETFVLDMGEQIKVLDIARSMITLSGFVPGVQIPIKFIGLRPGEKLVEELVGAGETLEKSEISNIFRVRWPEGVNASRLAEQVEVLLRLAREGQVAETIEELRCMVPTFVHPAYDLTVGGDGRGSRAAGGPEATDPASGSAPMPFLARLPQRT
jgi:FlaA1/EpsC-like NDP-sugar epimerase